MIDIIAYMLDQFIASNIWILLIVILWVLPWKGYALWLAARNTHKWWFIVLLVVNTLAILDILYIFIFSKPKKEKTTVEPIEK